MKKKKVKQTNIQVRSKTFETLEDKIKIILNLKV